MSSSYFTFLNFKKNIRINIFITIVGDYNIDLLKIEHKPIIKDYLDSIMTQGFSPKITLPTRFSDLNGTLIDNVLCRLSHILP